MSRPRSVAGGVGHAAAAATAAAGASARLVAGCGSISQKNTFGPSHGYAAARRLSFTAKAVDVSTLVDRVVVEPKREDAVKFAAAKGDAATWSGDLLIVPVFSPPESEDKDKVGELKGPAKDLDAALGGMLTSMIADNTFKGGKGESLSSLVGGQTFKRVALVGAGTAEKDTIESIGSAIAGVAVDAKATSALLVMGGEISASSAAFSTGVLAKLYEDDRFRTGDNVSKPPKLTSLEIMDVDSAVLDASVAEARGIAKGVRMAKDLVGAPPNFLTPSSMAGIAEKIAKETGMEVKIMDGDECESMGMGSYLGVSQGALEPPKFIHMTYKPRGEVKKKIALVGKGLTFDSGGYNLKAGAGSMIELMKFDMGGSAAVLGAAQSIGVLKPEGVEVHFIVAACENMLSDRAMRPGDILTASNGKTIEVINTDAEGRLTLADALIYAENLKVDKIVDLATLTGACIISLGNDYAGMWSSNDDLANELVTACDDAGEKMWRMPLVDSYKEEIKSKIADLKNVGGRAGGSITAALFLQEFIKDTPWAHIDMAGPVWDGKAGASTGYGVRTLVNFVTKQA